MRILYLTLLVLFSTLVYAQQNTKTSGRIVTGRLVDAINHQHLPSASVAIYTGRDTMLLSFQLSGNNGDFSLGNLPAGVPLRLVASFTGYRQLNKSFQIKTRDSLFHLGDVYMQRTTGDTLAEVVVQALIPMRMNGDTLEFNADAFKLGKNDVAEDLLRRLPGITVWNDGVITVFGREVKAIMVDGKPFLGGNSKLAIQNLAKSAIDKIQVYNTSKNPQTVQDSSLEMNIKLKKGQNFGYFGKVGVGGGNNKRYDGFGNITSFKPGTQLSMALASNNVNKTAHAMTELLEAGTYKSLTALSRYQPDLHFRGTNRPRMAGLLFQKDFTQNSQSTNRLSANYFYKNTLDTYQQDELSKTNFALDSTLTRETNTIQNKLSSTHIGKISYENRKGMSAFSFSPGFENQNSTEEFSSQLNTYQYNQTTGIFKTFHRQIINRNQYSFNGNLNTSLKPKSNGGNQSSLGATYSFFTKAETANNKMLTDFESGLTPSKNVYINRDYDNQNHSTNYKLDIWFLKYMKIKKHNSSIKFLNNFAASNSNQDSKVTDFYKSQSNTIVNNYLTNNTRYNTIDNTFGMELYWWPTIKNLSFFFAPMWQYYQLQHHSPKHDFQNINKQYLKFVPIASANYNFQRNNGKNDAYKLIFYNNIVYPLPEQLVLLTDSIFVQALRMANPALKPAENATLTLSWDRSFLRNSTTKYGVSVNGGIINNFHGDSTQIFEDGRSVIYKINSGKYKSMETELYLLKALKTKNDEWQFWTKNKFEYRQVPNYYNSHFNTTTSLFTIAGAGVSYNNASKIKVQLQHNYLWGSFRQSLYNVKRTPYQRHEIFLGASINITPKWNVQSNFTFSNERLSGLPTSPISLWNIYSSYRFMKKDNLEIKLSAVDMLNQNKILINSVSNNIATQQRTSSLRQYFMLGISYFPRQFGRRK